MSKKIKCAIIGWSIYLSGVFVAYPSLKYVTINDPNLNKEWTVGDRAAVIGFSCLSLVSVLTAGIAYLFIGPHIDLDKPAAW